MAVQVGDEVIVVRDKDVSREKVLKVGRKYFLVSCKASSFPDEFSLETGKQKGTSRGFPKYVYTIAEWERRQSFVALDKSVSDLRHQLDKWNIYTCIYLTPEWLADAKAKVDELTSVIGGRAIEVGKK